LFFKKRLERSLEDMSKKNGIKNEKCEASIGLNIEKNDILAMLIAAFITFVPIVVIFVAVVYFILWLFLKGF